MSDRRATAERKVLDAAAKLIALGGSSALTLAAVGRRADYSRGIVNYHFGTRERLLAALVRGAQQRVAPPASLGPGLDRLTKRVTTYLEAIAAGDAHARAFLLLWAESIAGTPALRSLFDERDRTLYEAVREDLEAGIGDGTIRPGLQVGSTAWALVGQIRGVALTFIVRVDTSGAAPVCAAFVSNLVTGLRP